MILDPNFDVATKEELRSQFGIDQSIGTQYFKYLKALITFDMGRSFSTRRLVWDELKERLPNTLKLFFVSFTATALLGISLGVFAAARRGTFAENFVTGAGLFAYAVPGFFIQLMLLMIFGYYLADPSHSRYDERASSSGGYSCLPGQGVASDSACGQPYGDKLRLVGPLYQEYDA